MEGNIFHLDLNIEAQISYALIKFILNMKSKYIVVPTAAFLLTAGTAFAFNTEVLEKIDVQLSSEKLEALEEAHELRYEGDRQRALAVLKEAGLTKAELRRLREAVKEHRLEVREQIKKALNAESYTAFREAISETHLADIVDTEQEFTEFVEAHNLLKNGEREMAKEIFKELGIPKKVGKHHKQ